MRACRINSCIHLIIHFIQFNHNYLNHIFIRLDVVAHIGGGNESATHSDTIAVVTVNRVTVLATTIIVVTTNLSDGIGLPHVSSKKWQSGHGQHLRRPTQLTATAAAFSRGP